MLLLIFIIASVFTLYTILILYFAKSWKQQSVNEVDISTDIFVSVIIAARDEEENIIDILNCLVKQDYTADKFEVILIDDHSTDNTLSKASTVPLPNLKLLKNPFNTTGKKGALKLGCQQAKGELLLFTDADCVVGENWISAYAKHYEKTRAYLISGPVLIASNDPWSNIQSLEFMSLVQSGAGAIAAERPIMVNGANMAVVRSVYLEHQTKLNEKWYSGDDMFMMLAILKEDRSKISFLNEHDGIVVTQAQPSLKKFLAQRARWAGKASGYRNNWINIVGGTVFLSNISIVGLFLAQEWTLFGIFLFTKAIPDYRILYQAASFYRNKKVLAYFPVVQLLYPFYVLISILLVFLPIRWKGRKLKNKFAFFL